MGTGCLTNYESRIDLEDEFYKDAVLDLKHGKTTYVYKSKILERLKQTFTDLEITKKDFYWAVKSNKKIKLKRGRPKNENGNTVY